MSEIPPHLVDEEAEARKAAALEVKMSKKFSLQWPSKYGPGGSRRYKAIGNKGRQAGKK